MGAGAAVVALTKSAVDAYGDYEQLVGGVETLFGTGGRTLEQYASDEGKTVGEISDEYYHLRLAQNLVMHNASKAFKTAGMSANDYMENVTAFSASLLQSLDGDSVAAAHVADMAMTDMSD